MSARGQGQGVRAGVDIGGTFTDVALEVGSVIHQAKVLTDYAAPERAIVTGMRIALEAAGRDFADVDLLIHGTTLLTNALIERRGARTAFITTEGFRDVLEMRTESRFEQYDLDIVLPPPLIERRDRYVLRERIDAAGRVLIAPEAGELATLVERIAADGYESVAVGFLHSYVNASHELLVRDAFARRIPDVPVSISAEVSPQMREFERFNTVCANAYVKLITRSYLGRLVASLKETGASCPVFMIHSGGGIISIETAAEFPVRLLESGPAGGAIFAADLARRHGLGSVLSFDMGGTTAKICLVEDYTPKTAKTFEVARTYRFKKGSGMPISIPVVEMVEIGAGGGSIASVDDLGRLRVGPRSAGSEPGPACYQRGGTEPTVSDADLILGRLDPASFAGGKIPLSISAASNAIEAGIAAPLDLDTGRGAYGISEVVDENMANAGRVHAVENGKDIARFTMVAFGGAGPLHAGRICEKMGIAAFLVPPGAGVGSAIGFLRAPFSYEAARSKLVRLSQFDAAIAGSVVASLTEEALGFVRRGTALSDPLVERTAFMRYVGQGWEIPVAMPAPPYDTASDAAFGALFREAYTRYFGRLIEELDVEIVSWAVKVSSPPRPVERVAATSRKGCARPVGTRRMFDPGEAGFIDAGLYERAALATGVSLDGPAIIVEPETSTIVPASFRAKVQADGSLLVWRADRGAP
jgi:N-methylhydantoinase A